MAVFKATQNKSDSAGKFKATKNRSYDSTLVYDWETRNKESYDALEKYRQRINSGGYLSADDLTAYRKALDSYVETSTSLRGFSKALGQGKDDDYEWTKTIADMESGYKGISDYFSQWKTEDSFKKSIAAQKEREEKLNIDTNAYRGELESLEAQRDALTKELDAADSSIGTANVDRSAMELVERIEALEKQIQEKKLYLNDASRLQEGVRLASVSGSEDFDENSGYVSTEYGEGFSWDKLFKNDYGLGYEDLTYEYINNQNGMRDKIKQKYRSYSADGGGDGESVYEENGYDQMREDEIAIYNYYYAKEGKAAAEKYLSSIQETLNARKATGMYENLEDNALLELAFGVAAGLDQFESGMKGLANAVAGNEEYVAPSATQIASGMVREDLADVGPNLPKWMGGASIGQVGYDAVTTTSNMLPSMLTSTAVNLVAPGAGAVVGTGLMGASAGGNAYQEMINLGYDKGQARSYAALVGGSEALLQYALGGISSLGGGSEGIFQTVAGKLLPHVDNAFARVAIKLGGNMLDEGLEEGLQEILNPWFQNLVLNADAKVDWSEVAYSSLLGALTAGVMEGTGTVSGEVNTYTQGRKLLKADISAERLAELGKTFAADTEAYQLAGKVNENTGAYTIGRLFNEIGATMTEQNVNDITNALVAKGWDEVTARKNAEALAYVIEGGQLSDKGVAKIEANETLAEVARAVLIDANSTVNQRTKGYNEALMALAQEKTGAKSSRMNPAEQREENAAADGTVDATKENGAESASEADTGPAKVKSIAAIKNKRATVALEDGTEADVRDVDLDPDDGVRIETIASIDGISSTDANFILKTLRENTGASAQMDSLGAKDAYRYGFYGFSKDLMTKQAVFANSLTAAQRDAIYEAGQKARQQQIEKASPKTTSKQRGVYFDYGGGNVVEFKDADKKTLTEDKRKAGVQAALILNKLGIGGSIYFYESYEKGKRRVYKDENGIERSAPNGWYSKGDGSIHIDLNAGKEGHGFVLFTLAHELTHFIEQWSPRKYKVLADFLVENYEKGQSMDALVRKKQDDLSQSRSKAVSYDEAYSEVVADSMEAMLADGNVLEKLIELKAKDQSLFMKMKQFFDNLLTKIRNAYKGQTPDSAEGKAVQEMTDAIERIQQLFAEALVDASENFQSVEAQKNTTQEGGVKHQFRGYAEDGRGVYESNFPKGTPKKAKAARILSLIQDVWSKKPITLKIEDENGTRYITAEFDPTYDETGRNTDASKLMGGNRHGTSSEQRVTLDLADDYYQIAEESTYNYSKEETGKDSDTHKDVRYWHYFINDIYFAEYGSNELAPCRVSINVKEKTDGNFFYSFSAEKTEETSTQRTLHAAVSSSNETATNGNLFNDTLTPKGEIVKNEVAEALDIEADGKTESIAPAVMKSERTWTESDYVQNRDEAAKEIAKAIGVSEKKAKAYINSVNSIAKMIADDRTRLDYFSSPGRTSFVGNVEYGGSFDFSTLCKKRRLLTGTFTAIQRALPNTALTADEILDIRNRMKEAGLEVSCGLCYVEGSRANMGQFAKEFLKLYKQYYPDAWQPNMADVNTPDGIEWVRINHPEVYEQYEYFWNHYGTLKEGDKNLFASQQKPKLYQLHTEYKGEILEKFNDDDNVEEKNLNGGIRLQSFSDFEIVHLIDTMQIIMDMARVGLAGQAYTKVPDFAWALGDTGLKINLSLIAKGVDADGKLIFDDVEGMPIDTAVKLRNRYSKNVGTILVAFNDEQLLAAMADDRVDFIIPFHRSQWKKSQYGAMGLPAKTKDYTYMQNEKFIKAQYHEYRGRMVKDKATNYMPNEYWDFSKSGKENAEAYLEMCARNNKRPKFYKLLQNNGDGSYSLKADGSTDGYWKLLIDFKMYDNAGVGSPQVPVKPDFNMEEATRMLDEYSGGHSNFPVAQGIVDSFVQEYKDSHEGVQFSDRDSDGNQLSAEQQKFFKNSKVRDKFGNLLRLFHGTESFGFTRVDFSRSDDGISFFMTDSPAMAESYSGTKRMQSVINQDKKNSLDPHTAPIKDVVDEYNWLTDSSLKLLDTKEALHEWADNHLAWANREIKKTVEMFDSMLPRWEADSKDEVLGKNEELIAAMNAMKPIAEAYRLAAEATTPDEMDAAHDALMQAQKQDDKVDRKNVYYWMFHSVLRRVQVAQDLSQAAKALRAASSGQALIAQGNSYVMKEQSIREDLELQYQYAAEEGSGEGNYELYANLTNPLIVEANGADWNEIVVPKKIRDDFLRHAGVDGFSTARTRDFARYAKKKGYDGVIIRDVVDYGANSAYYYEEPSTVVIAFDSNQVKDAYNQTPTSDPDFRYSERDAESVSNRSLLANAFEGVAKNDMEKQKIQEYRNQISLINAEEQNLSKLNQKIKDLSFAKGPKDTKAIRDLQFEARQTANRINTMDKILLRLEASKPLQDVLTREKEMVRKREQQKGKEALEAYRERATKTQRELLEKWQESRKKGIDSRQRTAMRHKIKDIVNELNQYLLKGTKDRHVPIGLQKAVAEALNAVNMDTVGADERIAKLNDELLKAKTPEEIQEISKRIDNIRQMGDRMDEKLKRLKTAYDEFIDSDDPLIANSHDDAVAAHMMRLIVRVGDTPLRDMTVDQLQDVYDVYKIVLATIRNANKSFKDNKNRDISTRANQVMAEIDNLGVKRGKRPVFMDWVEKFGWDGLKPVYAMEHIGSKGLIDAYNNVRAGEDTWAKDIVEAREYYLDKFRKYKYDSWDFEKKAKFTSTTGKNFELTLDQIMSLYAFSKRDQAADHLKYGGIVFDPKTEVVEKTKSGIKVKYNVANATAYNISEETLADIISALTADQKGFVDEMQTYLSDVMGAKGNEVSLAMYDVKLFREKHYFPLKSAHQYMAKAKEQAQGDVKIKNSGFSKETKPHAKNPIVLSSFMDVWTSHVNEMSMYHAFVLPMEDFYRIYNYTTPSKNENMPTEGVNAYIENAYGAGATGYIEQMLKDLNGGARTDPRTGPMGKLIGLHKKGAVFASLSVVVQQPSAIARAAALVDTKYFIGPKVDHKRHKALWDEVKQYAPVAIIKEMGYFDTNMGKSTQDYIMGQEYSGFKEKMKALVTDSNYRDEILSKAPALADEIAWCGIWEAVKRETHAQYPGLDVRGEPFLMLAGSRFTEVITKTQVYDSVLSRSAMMRSKDTGMKMATAFMAEPTTSINMVADALLKGKRGDRKYCRTAIGAVVASQIINSILVSFVYAGRDDDEDETYAEKYIGTLAGEILDSLNPATYIPFIKDIVSIVQGYDVERSDMAIISDLVNAWRKLGSDNLSVYRKVEGFAGSIAQIFGLPVKNIMRDMRAFWQTVIQPVIDKAKGIEREKTTAAGIGYAIKGAITGKDVSNQNQLYEAYMSGDKAQIARVEGRYKDQSSINSAIRKALRENDPRILKAAQAVVNGNGIERANIAREIAAEGHFDLQDIQAAINAEIDKLRKEAKGK